MRLWFIWKARNSLIVNNLNEDPLEVVEEMKVMSWRWRVHRGINLLSFILTNKHGWTGGNFISRVICYFFSQVASSALQVEKLPRIERFTNWGLIDLVVDESEIWLIFKVGSQTGEGAAKPDLAHTCAFTFIYFLVFQGPTMCIVTAWRFIYLFSLEFVSFR
ncbi:unnamed protein product [Trifolium pratense]|uniref:Uncharacterized protein n=1 Tax=Trifolium pratense TaxID=57577 RepID=A0ACB0K4T6_TRIPR|nr:unnamed protein product [Trifolium pratense]